MKHAVGLDVGGTRIRGGIVRQDGSVEMVAMVATGVGQGADEVIAAMVDVIDRCAQRVDETLPVGVAIPGIPDKRSQRLEHVSNLPSLKGVELGRRLSESTGLAVTVVPDIHAAALAESRFGAGRGSRRLIVACVGTGLGASVLLDGSFVRHTRGLAGSLGHLVVDPNGPACGCGGRGCIEALAAGPALRREVERRMGPAWLRERADGESPEAIWRAILDGLGRDEGGVVDAVREVGRWLGYGLASWAAIYKPDRVVLAGGLASLGDVWLVAVREGLRQVSPAFYRDALEICRAEYPETAGVLGAGLWAMDEPAVWDADG